MRKIKNYWNDVNNVFSSIKPLINDGKFPNYKIIKDAIGTGVLKGIRNFGGINEVAKLMGYVPPTYSVTSDGHFVNSYYEYLLDEYLHNKNIKHEVNGLIAPGISRLRYDFKINDHYVEIWGLSIKGGVGRRYDEYEKRRKKKELFYKKLNLKFISIEPHIFNKSVEKIMIYFESIFKDLGCDADGSSIDIIINFIKPANYWTREKVMEELSKLVNNLNRLPTSKDMVKHSTYLYQAVRKYGGLYYFADLFKLNPSKVQENYWTEKKIIEELTVIISQIKKFPSMQKLEYLKCGSLINGIRKFGGMKHFREIMKVHHANHLPGYWNEEIILNELKNIMLLNDGFPSQTYLQKNNTKLFRAIRCFGGLPKIRAKIAS